MITFLKIILVLAILVAMIILLLGLNQVFTGEFDSDDSDAVRLRREVEKNQEVISEDSVFNTLLRHPQRVDAHDRMSKRS